MGARLHHDVRAPGYHEIATVAKLTGIDVMTLRNCERRYGVIVAPRDPGRQRAFSTSTAVQRAAPAAEALTSPQMVALRPGLSA